MSLFIKSLIDQSFALVYIDDIIILSTSKEHMLQPFEKLHIKSTKYNLQLAAEKLVFHSS